MAQAWKKSIPGRRISNGDTEGEEKKDSDLMDHLIYKDADSEGKEIYPWVHSHLLGESEYEHVFSDFHYSAGGIKLHPFKLAPWPAIYVQMNLFFICLLGSS